MKNHGRTFAALALLLAALPAWSAPCARYPTLRRGATGPAWHTYLHCAVEADRPTINQDGDTAYSVAEGSLCVWITSSWTCVAGGSGAPTGASYWTRVAEGGLSAETAMGALGTGLVINTTTTGVPTIYAGAACTDQLLEDLSASGAPTCSSVGTAYLADAAVTFAKIQDASAASKLLGRGAAAGAGDFEEITLGTNLSMAGTTLNASGGGSTPTGTGFRHVTAGAEDAASVLVNLTSATHVAANQGTTTTVLHGNAAGQASFGAVDLANDTSSTLPLAKLTDDASSGLCLLSGGGGDPAWTACPGGGGGLSYAQVAAAALAGF